MTTPAEINFKDVALDNVAETAGKLVVFVGEDGKLDAAARRVNSLTRKALARFVASAAFEAMSAGDVRSLAYPSGLAAEAILVVKLDRRPTVALARNAGAEIAKTQGAADLTILGGTVKRAEDIALGLALRGYSFDAHKSADAKTKGRVTFMVSKPEQVAKAAGPLAAIAEGVYFTRDLTNEPARTWTGCRNP